MGEMDPDLMSASCLELAFDQAVSSDFFQLRHLSFCVLTLSWIDQALAPIVAIASDFILVDDGFLCQASLDQGPVLPLDLLLFQNSVENGQDKRIFGK